MRSIARTFICCLLLISSAGVVHARLVSPLKKIAFDSAWPSSLRFSFLENNRGARLGMPLSVGPDFASVRLGLDDGKWKNLVGQNIGLIKMNAGSFTASSVFAGFIELHNITPQFMSWQLWRGNLGFDFYFNDTRLDRLLPAKSTLVLKLGWTHESQHVTDLFTFTYMYTNYSNVANSMYFDNGSERSFEYYTIQLNYQLQTSNEQWLFILSPGYRYFPDPLLMTAKRNLTRALNVEAGVHYKLGAYQQVYAHVFKEAIYNQFVSGGEIYKHKWNMEPFQYLTLEGGFQFSVGNRELDIFVRYNRGNGRGFDFLEVGEDVGAGVRFLL